MPCLPCLCIGERGLLMDFCRIPFLPRSSVLLNQRFMHPTINNIGGTVNYHDNHKEFNIDTHGRDLSDILRQLDTTYDPADKDILSVPPECYSDNPSHFPYLTKKCFEQKRVDTVEAEIRAACKGTAENLWRTLWNNENLGYLEVAYVDATTLYRAIEKWYGKLPYTERNFRGARNKR